MGLEKCGGEEISLQEERRVSFQRWRKEELIYKEQKWRARWRVSKLDEEKNTVSVGRKGE